MTKRQVDRLGIEAAARILALQRLGESDAEFARRIGLSPQQVNNYKNEGRGASLEVVRDVAVRTGVTVDHFLGVESEVSAAAARQADAQAKLEEIRRIIDRDPSLAGGAAGKAGSAAQAGGPSTSAGGARGARRDLETTDRALPVKPHHPKKRAQG